MTARTDEWMASIDRKDDGVRRVVSVVVAVLVLAGCRRLSPPGSIEREVAPVPPFVAPPATAPLESDIQKLRRVAVDTRTLAVTLEVSLNDAGQFPRSGPDGIAVGEFVLVPLVSIGDVLPRGSQLAADDPWGNPYLYWSSGRSYLIVCTGSDGVISSANLAGVLESAVRPTTSAPPVTTSCLEDEIVFSGDEFVQSPGDDVRQCTSR